MSGSYCAHNAPACVRKVCIALGSLHRFNKFGFCTSSCTKFMGKYPNKSIQEKVIRVFVCYVCYHVSFHVTGKKFICRTDM